MQKKIIYFKKFQEKKNVFQEILNMKKFLKQNTRLILILYCQALLKQLLEKKKMKDLFLTILFNKMKSKKFTSYATKIPFQNGQINKKHNKKRINKVK